MMQDMSSLLLDHSFFRDLPAADVRLMAACGRNVAIGAGELISQEGEEANEFFVIRHGRVAIETFVPERGAVTIQTLGDGEVFGWSWLFPPYRWTFGARAIEPTRVVALNGKCIREKCERDPSLGYRLIKKFAQIMTARLQATRLQLLDVYGQKPAKGVAK